jgi:hypothetical protein
VTGQPAARDPGAGHEPAPGRSYALRRAPRSAEAERAADPATAGKAHYVLSREGFWSGELARGAEHGKQAVQWLERADER